MWIEAIIADWPQLLRHLEIHGADFSEVDGSWYHSSTITRWNKSCLTNSAFGEMFLDVRSELPGAEADRLGEFLAAVCPVVADEGPYPVPTAAGVFHEAFYSAMPPEEVRRRLALLDSVDLHEFFTRAGNSVRQYPGCALGGSEQAVVEFVFMWAAAFGVAVSKGWGLIVAIYYSANKSASADVGATTARRKQGTPGPQRR